MEKYEVLGDLEITEARKNLVKKLPEVTLAF